ncbi:ABC transporter substrate-binding protein [Natronosalvus caseinilyticus]|uniref:ABC transporter substrate-binding protein n=1 Tax=Natronosalvus caseinilyticus TaxID=2953747 RepID=UPI0028AFCD2A|nr:ABC transporter substrate-binding protein [Natronosalvus caseinilyticus]
MGNQNGVTRRRYLVTTGAIGTAALAGCADDEEGNGNGNATGNGDGNGNGGGDGDLEIVHWWTAGGEEEAFNALVDGYDENTDYTANPNPAPGGAGSSIDAAIQTRVIDEEPPGTFQIWPGEALRTYTDADALEPVGDFYEDGAQDAYLDSVVEAATIDGDVVSVPINIHRLNNIFYNVEVLDDAGVDVESIDGPEGLLEAFETVDGAGYVGMAQQTAEPWGTLQLWEVVFTGQHGVDTFQQFLDGNAADLESEINESLSLVADYSEYFNEDASTVSWDEANNAVITGDAAFHHNGDWAAGEYQTAEDFEYGEGWDYAAFPGTEGVYTLVMDSFVMPTNNPTPDATEAWIEYCSTVDAQERFNPAKGSIPPRTDVPTDEFPPFLQDQMSAFQDSDEQITSIAHGSGLQPAQASEVQEAFAVFTDNWDPDETTQELINIF